jgi:hypothetical protein
VCCTVLTDRNFAARDLGVPGVLVLLFLSGGAKHGHAIRLMRLSRPESRLGPPRCRALTKLVDRGLVLALPAQDRRRHKVAAIAQAATHRQLAPNIRLRNERGRVV